jgi:hypothetical protein
MREVTGVANRRVYPSAQVVAVLYCLLNEPLAGVRVGKVGFKERTGAIEICTITKMAMFGYLLRKFTIW